MAPPPTPCPVGALTLAANGTRLYSTPLPRAGTHFFCSPAHDAHDAEGASIHPCLFDIGGLMTAAAPALTALSLLGARLHGEHPEVRWALIAHALTPPAGFCL